MRIAILEDEAPARRLLVDLLSKLDPQNQVVAELDSLESARGYFSRASADLVLSDIRLADGSALTLFEEGTIVAPVIFVTAYDTWLEKAFAYLSVDYLLKPIDEEALRRALLKVARLQRHFGALEAREAAALLSRRPRERLLVHHKGETKVLAVADIAFFRADDKLTLAVDATAREYVVDRTLTQLEAELDATRFFRANRAYLVQISSIASFRSAGRGRIALSLSPAAPDEVVVSQESAAPFRAFVDR